MLVNAFLGFLLSIRAQLLSVNPLKALEVDRRITHAEMITMLPAFHAARVGASVSSLYLLADNAAPLHEDDFGNELALHATTEGDDDAATGLGDVQEIDDNAIEDPEVAASQGGAETANEVAASEATGMASSASAIDFQCLLDETSEDCLPLEPSTVSDALGANVASGTKPLNVNAARISRNGGRIGQVAILRNSPPSTPTRIRHSGPVRMLTDRDSSHQSRSLSSIPSGSGGTLDLCDNPFDDAYYPYAWETRSSGGVLRLKSEGVPKHMRTVFLDSPQRPRTRQYEHPSTTALRGEVSAHIAAAQARQDLMATLEKVYSPQVCQEVKKKIQDPW